MAFSMFNQDIGIDLGTANTLIFSKGKGIIMREPSVVAVDTRTDTVRYVGQEAKDVIGRTPGSIVAVRPLKDGVIADFDIAASMLQIFIKKVFNNSVFARPRVVICIPSGVTEVERRAVIGGGTSEVAVISLGGIVASKSVRVGGDEFDAAIISYIKRKYNLLVGERSAEAIKMTIGSAFPFEEELEMEIKGRNLVDGLPKNMFITSEEIRDALSDPLSAIMDAIKSTLERTPPELSADIIDHGITLTGGGSLLHNIDKLVSKETGMPVYIAENALDCVAEGAGLVLDNLDLLKEVVSDSERRLG